MKDLKDFEITHIEGHCTEGHKVEGDNVAKAVGIYCADQIKRASTGDAKAAKFVKGVFNANR